MGVPVALGEAGEDVARRVVSLLDQRDPAGHPTRTPRPDLLDQGGDVDDAGSAAAQGSCRLTRRPMGRADQAVAGTRMMSASP